MTSKITVKHAKYAQRMYEKFFGLSRDPFSIAPDPRYLFMSERHREALAHLLYGVNAGGGFVLLSGNIGTGKTTVCRCFLEQIPAHCHVAYIFNPKLTVEELLTSICDEFHVALPPSTARGRTAKSLIDPLNAFLLGAHAAGQNSVLIIDEAQNLSSNVLEQLRLLTNLETNERKLLQIILIGQPELRDMLARPELEQLAQRVMARFHLEALSPLETSDYIAHRLAVAGLTAPLPFDKKALARVYTLSRGVPRRINLLCGRALLGAYATGKPKVNRTMLEKAAQEVFGADAPAAGHPPNSVHFPALFASRTWLPMLLASAVGLAAGAALVGGGGLPHFGKAHTTAAAPAQSVAVTPALVAVAPLPLSPPLRPLLPSSPLTTAAAMTAPTALPAASLFASNTTAASRLTSQADFAAALTASTATQNQAWRALGPLWRLALDSPDACAAAQAQGAFCHTRQPTSLLLIRQLDRPGFLTLTNKSGQRVYALLTGLTADTATLTLDKTSLTVALPVVVEAWNGAFSTLWRQPAGLSSAPSGQAPEALTQWLSEQLLKLAKDQGTTNDISTGTDGQPIRQPTARERINAFQVAQGLPVDGLAGPLTIMQLNRAMRLPEPQLTSPKH